MCAVNKGWLAREAEIRQRAEDFEAGYAAARKLFWEKCLSEVDGEWI